MKVWLVAGLAVLAVSAKCNAAEVAAGDARFGPLRLGMSAAEVGAALPGARITAATLYELPAAFDFAGVPVDVVVDLNSLEGGSRLEMTASQPAAAGECQARMAALIQALEPQVGPLHPDELAGYTLVPAGRASRYGWFTSAGFGHKGLVQSSAFIRKGEGPMVVNVQANEDWNSVAKRLECRSWIRVRWGLRS